MMNLFSENLADADYIIQNVLKMKKELSFANVLGVDIHFGKDLKEYIKRLSGQPKEKVLHYLRTELEKDHHRISQKYHESVVNAPRKIYHQEKKGFLLETLQRPVNQFNTYADQLQTNEQKIQALFALLDDAVFHEGNIHTDNWIINQTERDIQYLSEYLDTKYSKDILITHYCSALRTFISLKMWNQYKKIYQVDADFYTELIKTEKIKCDFSMLTKQPFPSFYIDLSSAPVMSTSHYYHVAGVLVNILNDKKIHLSIIDDDCVKNNPALEYDHKILYQGNCRFIDVILDADLTGHEISKGSVFEDVIYHTPYSRGIDYRSPVFADLILFTLHFLLFLNSRTEDILPVHEESPVEKHINDSISGKEIEKWKVGFHYGEKIRLLHRKESIYGSILQIDKKRPSPYVRCAHWHKHWCGTGENRHLELRWHEPVFCNGTMNDIITSISPVTSKEAAHSSGEELIKQYLERMHVDFSQEYIVRIKNHNRRFDFHVMLNQKEYLIEFDGEQHFKPVEQFGGKEQFLKQQKADFDKNKWAKSNHIPLLRIRFDQIQAIPELIDSFFEKPSIRQLNPMMDNAKYYKI